MISPLLLMAAFQLQATGAPANVAPVFNARTGSTEVRLSGAVSDATVEIDGKLDEPVWRTAPLLTGFSLYQPADGRPAPDSTEVMVWYSPTALYFGIRAYEPHGIVRATLADRDRISSDDNIEIHLDTFHERRRAFVFIVNPLGVQADGTKSEGGGFIPGSNIMPGQNDLSPDFLWQSKGHVTDWGYEVEVRIPFSSLRYESADNQRWGLQFDRHVQHSGYEETWTPALRANASFITQEGWLSGLTGLQHGQSVSINPEVTTTVSGTPCCTPSLTDWHYKSDPTIGGNVRWGAGSNLVLNGTVRPDFSQVEADAAQIAADERFALFYPERRPFFVEGAEQFNAPNTLVYTRRIVQPDAALKLTGKLGRMNFAVLSALDSKSTTATGDRPLVDIVRMTRDFGDASTAGLLYSERVGGGRTNRMAGADVRYVFGKYFAQAQGVASTTGSNGVTNSGALWEAVLDRTGRAYGFHYNIFGVTPDFRTDNGFVARTGYVQPSISNRFTLYGKQGQLFERWNVFGTTSALWRYHDFFSAQSLLEDKVSAMNQVTLRGGWSLGLTPTLQSFAFDPAAYAGVHVPVSGGSSAPFEPSSRMSTFTTSFSVATPQFRRFAASAGMTVGPDVDFLETSRIERTGYNASLDVRPNTRIRLNATYVSTEFNRRSDNTISSSSRIPRVKLEYQVARSVFVRLVSQYEATRRLALLDPRTGQVLLVRGSDGTFAPSVSRSSNLLRADWLFSYRPHPGTVFFAGYGNSLTEPDALSFNRLRRVSDGFFVKVSYVFSTQAR